MRGVAHVGVLRALRAHAIAPDMYVGTSVGSFVAALAAGGMSPQEIEEVARSIRPDDILDYSWWGLLWKRRRATALCRGRALHDFVRRTLPQDDFARLLVPLYVFTVNLDTGQETVFGMEGFTQVPIHDAVVASCSIPGIFPPKRIHGYRFVDGSLTDSLPIKVALYHRADVVIAVYLDVLDATSPPARNGEATGISTVIARAQTILSRALLEWSLRYFDRSKVILIRPNVAKHGLFEFDDLDRLIAEGERAAETALDDPAAASRLRTD